MSNLIYEKELLDVFGFERPADLRRCLTKQNVPFYLGKGGRVVTTIDAVNMPLIGGGNNDNRDIEFE